MGIKPRANFCCFLFLLYAVSVSASAFSLSGTSSRWVHILNMRGAGSVDGKDKLPPNTHHHGEGNFQQISGGSDRSARRLLIGSTAPICTYNECRGCKTRCSAEEMPVNANDPMNSAYRYRCICHR